MSVYRVAGLPAGISKQTARSIIDQFFVSETQIVIRSLGLHPQTNSIVAISMFFPIPARLLQGNSWKLEQTASYEGAAEPQLVQLEIDTHFLGFTPLNVVACDNSDNRIDCILVSGLSSHPFGSWKERGGQFMWLVDDEDANPAHVRVFLYGYDTSLFRSESFQDITDIGERLAVSIRGIRSHSSIVRTPEQRPIVFIAHSLGGLVVKEAICHMAREEPSTMQGICGFVFFGVPHHGLLVEPWLRIIDKQPNKQLVENLRPGSRYLQRLDEDFRKSFTLRSFKVVTIYETCISKTTKEEEAGVITRSGDKEVLVNPTSALGHWPDSVNHTRIPVNRSHEDLPKFRGRFDEDYLALKPYLQEVWASATLNDPKAANGFGIGERRPDDGGNRRDQPKIVEVAASGTTPAPCTLTSLWPDPETEDVVYIPTTIDIIAINGLGGDSLNSWREGDKLWLRDFLPWSLPEARVLTFGYDGDLLFTGSSSNIRHFATLLLDNVKQLRQKTGETVDRKTIFLCHDFGGIIFKQALVMAFENESSYSDFAKSVTGVIFLGTPHQGPDIVFWSELLGKFALLDKSRINLLQHLQKRSTELGTICTQFVERSLHLQVFSLYETRLTSGLNAKIVDESSAVLRLPNETTLSLNADHMSMCRYLSSSSQNYVTVSECIAEFFDTMSGKPDQTLLNRSGREFLSELRAVDAVSTLNRIPNHGNTSSSWLLDHPEFRSWTQLQGRQVIWVHGPPGAGKTTLMRSIVAYLAMESETAKTSIISKPLYFFFDDKDSMRKDSMAFVRSILDQIVRDSRTSYLLMYVNERDLKAKRHTEDNLWMVLSTILERSRGVMFQFVVDAMDEVLRSSTSYSITILDRLERLLSIDSSGRIRLLISSRKKPFTEFLEANLAFIDVDNEVTRRNVESFVRTQVLRWLERSYISISVGERIEKKIMEVSQGNFLHARLALEQFSEGVHQWSREDVRLGLDRIDRVSHGLASAYCDLLKSIPEQHRGQAKAAFAILRVSQGKINSRQLSFFATLQHRKSSNNNDQTTVEALKSQSGDFESYLDEACGYMIRRADDGMVDFTHVSAKDLFTECLEGLSPQEQQTIAAYAMSEPDAHLMMHELCMSILQLEGRDADVWRKTLYKLESAIGDRGRSFRRTVLSKEDVDELAEIGMTYIRSIGRTPCILYAVQNLMLHYTAGSPDNDVDSRLATFLRTVPAYYYHKLWYLIRTESKPYENTYQATHTRPKASTLDGLFRAVVQGDCPRVVKAIIGKALQ